MSSYAEKHSGGECDGGHKGAPYPWGRSDEFLRKQKSCWLKNALGSLSMKRSVDVGIR